MSKSSSYLNRKLDITRHTMQTPNEQLIAATQDRNLSAMRVAINNGATNLDEALDELFDMECADELGDEFSLLFRRGAPLDDVGIHELIRYNAIEAIDAIKKHTFDPDEALDFAIKVEDDGARTGNKNKYFKDRTFIFKKLISFGAVPTREQIAWLSDKNYTEVVNHFMRGRI